MALREKLRNMKMTKTEKVSSFLTRITQVRDELGAVGEVITDGELVRTTLLRLDSNEGLHHAWCPSMVEDNET